MTQPRTSSTPQPGYNTNQTPNGAVTHQQWVDAFVDYWSARWAHGDRTLPQGFNSNTFGLPDQANNNGTASPATLLAFARYANAYRPGMDPVVDGTMPWVAPGPNDFVEDPAVTSARVAQDNWDRTFGQTQSNADRQAWQQQWANDVQRYGYQVQAGQNANNFAASLFSAASGNWQAAQNFAAGIYNTQAGIANNQNNFSSNIYGTQAGMYNANEGNRLGALGQAGSLANSLQQAWDARTNNAIQLQAHPNDFIQRESAVRALAGPQGTDVPGYSNVDALSEVIKRLINFTPGTQPNAPSAAATPTAPTMTPQPSQPGYVAPPGPPTQQTFQQFAAQNFNPVVAATRPTGQPTPTQSPTVTNYGPGGNVVTPQPAHYGSTPPTRRPVTIDPNVQPDVSGYRWDSANGEWVDPAHGNTPYTDLTADRAAAGAVPGLAHGGTTSLSQFISGDPQYDGQPNPELVEVLNPGPKTRTRVTPLKQFGDGTDAEDSDNAIYGMGAQLPGTYQNFQPGLHQRYQPGVTKSRMSKEEVLSEILRALLPKFAYGTQIPMYAYGTDVGYQVGGGSGATPVYNTQPAPQVTLKSYADSAYQNLPSLRYLQGNMDKSGYNTLATGNAPGAFGTQAPESGSINYGKWLDVANDPVSAALLDSIYASANRDLASEVSRAKARAPFGQAVQTSLIRT